MSSRERDRLWKLRHDGFSRLQEGMTEAVKGEETSDEGVDEIEVEWKGGYLYSTVPHHAFLIGDCSESQQCIICE
jgi:hypothetical protein